MADSKYHLIKEDYKPLWNVTTANINPGVDGSGYFTSPLLRSILPGGNPRAYFVNMIPLRKYFKLDFGTHDN